MLRSAVVRSDSWRWGTVDVRYGGAVDVHYDGAVEIDDRHVIAEGYYDRPTLSNPDPAIPVDGHPYPSYASHGLNGTVYGRPHNMADGTGLLYPSSAGTTG